MAMGRRPIAERSSAMFHVEHSRVEHSRVDLSRIHDSVVFTRRAGEGSRPTVHPSPHDTRVCHCGSVCPFRLIFAFHVEHRRGIPGLVPWRNRAVPIAGACVGPTAWAPPTPKPAPVAFPFNIAGTGGIAVVYGYAMAGRCLGLFAGFSPCKNFR